MMVEFLIPQIFLLEAAEVELLLLEQREHQHKRVMVEQEQMFLFVFQDHLIQEFMLGVEVQEFIHQLELQ
jgi:hypothetical protein